MPLHLQNKTRFFVVDRRIGYKILEHHGVVDSKTHSEIMSMSKESFSTLLMSNWGWYYKNNGVYLVNSK